MIDIKHYKEKILVNRSGPTVRFINSNGETVRLEDGYRHPKWENVIHKTHYWGIFSLDTIKELEERYQLKAIIS